MNEEYEIIFITEEGRAILNKKTKKVYHSEFEIIDEKNKQIEDLQQRVEQLENIRKEAIEYAQDLRFYDNESIEFKISTDLLNILNKGSDKE